MSETAGRKLTKETLKKTNKLKILKKKQYKILKKNVEWG